MYNLGTMVTKKATLVAAAVLAVFVLGTVSARAQAPASDVPISEVIKKFAEKEKEFKAARDNYIFRQEVVVEDLGRSNRKVGEYRTTTEISFDEKGRRTERVTHAPPDTLKNFTISKEDLQSIESIQPFVLTSDDIGQYDLKYGGKEKVDEITCFVFDVSPKKIEKDKRYFEGKIWVDDQDFQIVKTFGKSVPDIRGKNNENLFPKFETYREQIDGQYWFPTYTRAVDVLNFSTGAIHFREIVRYTDYKKFQTSVKLKFGGEVTDGKSPASSAPSSDKEKLAPLIDPNRNPKTDKK
jgi:outer membrane lipoprotein-sorting protein